MAQLNDKKAVPFRVGEMLLALAAATPQAGPRRKLAPPKLLPGVVPKGRKPDAYVALDSAEMQPYYSWGNASDCFLGFPGYPYLSNLAQISEYRAPCETIAQEMTRGWIELRTKGKGKKSKGKSAEASAAKLEDLNGELEELGVQDSFRRLIEQDQFFGRSQLYIDIDGQDGPDRRKLPLIVAPQTIKKNSLNGFKVIEPIWTTPFTYNSLDPASPSFFKPTAWFVLGKQTHASRLLTIVSREVPDLLKPSYNFGGLSLTQLMEPYVNQWIRTRNSIADLIHAFSLSGLATDMQSTLSGDETGTELFNRMRLYNSLRDNRGLMIINKDSEEFFQFNTPLSGLAELQAQAQEHMAAPSHIPLVKLLGITPTGLNASSEGEIKVFYDFIHASQEAVIKRPLQRVLDIVQLSCFGAIDESITFEFVPLTDPTIKELSEVRKSDADAGVAYVNSGVVSPQEERQRLASDPNSGYNSLDPDEVPDPLPTGEEDPEGGPPGTDVPPKKKGAEA